MEITIGGKAAEVRDGITIAELLKEQQVKNAEYVTVSLDEVIYNHDQFADTVVQPGVAVEFLYFMGGGSGESH